jgi:hypothetical protein
MSTDAELTGLDVPALLHEALGTAGGARSTLFGDGAVAAAIAAEGVPPGALTFLAAMVRAGGVPEAVKVCGPPARPWLEAARGLPEAEEDLAKWLEAVAVIASARRASARPDRSP